MTVSAKHDAGGAPRIAVVVIGRNEGERLGRCLASLSDEGVPVVYVDSGSTDDSVARARTAMADVVELTPDKPFTAARGRNEGFAALKARFASLPYVQFVDGDCALEPGWLDAAIDYFDANAAGAAVVGQLSERNARKNVYHRLCAMEWKGVAGEIRNADHFGGISAVRCDAFEAIGGFDATMIAGEDPDMAARLLLGGRRIDRLALPMAVHDAEMDSFGQFWTRAVRAGYGAGMRSTLRDRASFSDSARAVKSMLVWGAVLPFAALALALPSRGISLVVLIGGYGMLIARVARHRRMMADSWSDALLYGASIVVMKFAGVIGLATYVRRRRRNVVRLIEYK